MKVKYWTYFQQGHEPAAPYCPINQAVITAISKETCGFNAELLNSKLWSISETEPVIQWVAISTLH